MSELYQFISQESFLTHRSTIQDELEKSLKIEEAGQRHAAVCLLIVPKGNRLQFLVFKRSQRDDDPWSGHFALPGGGKELADQNLLETAMRETYEEVGVELQESQLLGRLDQFFIRTRTKQLHFSIQPYCFLLESFPSLKIDPLEVEKAYWVSFDHLFDLDKLSFEPLLRSSPELHLPCFKSQDICIWGITYVILRNFQQKLTSAFNVDQSLVWPPYQNYL